MFQIINQGSVYQMELINSRYRIIKNIRQNTFVSSYIAVDILSKNNKIQLNIINPEYLPEEILNFFTTEFITLINLNCSNMIRVYNFGLINFIDNKKVGNFQYYYTNEFIEDSERLSKINRKFELQEILDLFIEICIAVNYLHLKGFFYGELNLNNIIINSNWNGKVKLTDIATNELQKYNYQVSRNEYVHFKAPEVLKGDKPSVASDIYSLGTVLLTLSKDNCITELSDIITKMVAIEPSSRYKSVYEIIQDINNTFSTTYKSVIKDEIEQLSFNTKLIGREYEIDKIVSEYGNLLKYEQEKRVILVHGEQGIGKTRLLEELKHLLRMKSITVVDTFAVDSSSLGSNKSFIEFLKKIISECDSELVEKYQSTLAQFIPELGTDDIISSTKLLSDEKSRFKLLNSIAGFIGDFLTNKQVVFIIDNINFMDGFALELLEYLYIKKLNAKGVMFILSYCDGSFVINRKFADFVKKLSYESNVTDVALHGLSGIETGLMLQNILNMPHSPVEFAGRIYSKTYGNPQFIQETVKTLYSNKIIYTNEGEGHWVSKYDNFNEIPIPTNIEQAVLNQLNDLDNNNIDLLNIISVFNSAVSVDVVSKFFNDSVDYIQEIINDMVQRGILCKKIEDRGFVFDFSNTVLKNLMYGRLNEESKKSNHEMAVSILENQGEYERGSTDELIYHLEKAGNKDKVIKYCVENAEKMELLRNRNEAIKNLEKAISMYDREAVSKNKLFLLTRVGDIYTDCGSISNAINYYVQAEVIASKLNEYENEIDIINNITACYLNKNDILKAEEYIQKAETKLECREYKKGYLIYKKNVLEILLVNDRFDNAFELCSECIEICGDEFMEIKGHFYSKYGDVCSFTSDSENARRNYEESIKCFDKVHYEKGMVLALNNIGVLYSDTHQDMQMALHYFNKMKDISEKNNFILAETLALTNIASTYYYSMKYDTALKNFNDALEKAKNIEYESNVLYCYCNICSINLKFYEYKRAHENFQYAQNEFKEYPLQKKDVSGSFYAACADLYFEYGDMEKAESYAKKVLEIFGNDDVKTKWENVILGISVSIISKSLEFKYDLDFIRKVLNKFSFKKNKLDIMYNLCILLSENGYKEEAFEIFKDAELYNCDSNRVEAKRLYCSSLMRSEEDRIDILLKALKLSKEENLKKLFCKLSSAIADYYMEKKNYFYAVNFYFDACDAIKSMALQVPEKFRLNFMKTHNMLVPFARLYNINLDMQNDETACEWLYDCSDITNEALDRYFNFNSYSNILNNNNYIRSAKKLYSLKSPQGINGLSDIISNLPSDPVEGLEIILQYVSSITLSTNGVIVTESGGKEFSVVASINEKSEIEHGRYLIERAKSVKEPILITEYRPEENTSEISFMPSGIKAVICIPIIMDDRHSSGLVSSERRRNFHYNSQLKGILYLESDKILNNFNSNTFQKCRDISRLIGSLIEKYQLVLSSSVDKLTGVYTRKYLEDFITDTIENTGTRQENVSFIMFDFDFFKMINDRYGHQTGDEVLKKVCKIVTSCIRKEDICGRYGGEEFIVVLPGANKEQAYIIAEKLRTRVEGENILGNKALVTISLGISTYPEHGHWKQELIEKADQALYVSKQTGRNKSQVWNSEFSSKAKSMNKLTGIVTGNSVQDYRNVLAIADISELIKSSMDVKNKIYSLLGRIIEITEAQHGMLFDVKNKNIVEKYGREIFYEKWANIKKYNKNIIDMVIDKQQGVFIIDWDSIVDYDAITGIPDWQSIIVVPIILSGIVKGVLYLTVSTKVKEFNLADFNFVNLLGQIAAAII